MHWAQSARGMRINAPPPLEAHARMTKGFPFVFSSHIAAHERDASAVRSGCAAFCRKPCCQVAELPANMYLVHSKLWARDSLPCRFLCSCSVCSFGYDQHSVEQGKQDMKYRRFILAAIARQQRVAVRGSLDRGRRSSPPTGGKL